MFIVWRGFDELRTKKCIYWITPTLTGSCIFWLLGLHLRRCARVRVSIQLVQYTNNNALLSSTHHGFRPKLSTETALLQVSKKIYGPIDNRKIYLITLCDLSKAFDCASRDILLKKNALNYTLTTFGLRTVYATELNLCEWETTCPLQYSTVVSHSLAILVDEGGVCSRQSSDPIKILLLPEVTTPVSRGWGVWVSC